VLIAVGALGWEKNQAAMLRVLAEIRRTLPETILLLAGDGPERPKLERLAAELGVVAAVLFLGVRQDVPELLAAADLFLLTSLTEGVPGVLIEAGMAGLPAVTWDVAGAKEVVQDGVTGRVTTYQDQAGFTAAVIALLSNPGKAAIMGQAAREFCRERFGMERCVAEHLRLFEEITRI
jgi:glycosyltransferase involved in cell wall biosynthesis